MLFPWTVSGRRATTQFKYYLPSYLPAHIMEGGHIWKSWTVFTWNGIKYFWKELNSPYLSPDPSSISVSSSAYANTSAFWIALLKFCPEKHREERLRERGRQQPHLIYSSSEVKPRLDGLRFGRRTPLKGGGTFLIRSPTKNPPPANTCRTTTYLSSLSYSLPLL